MSKNAFWLAAIAATSCSPTTSDSSPPKAEIDRVGAIPVDTNVGDLLILARDAPGMLSIGRGVIIWKNSCLVVENGEQQLHLIWPNGSRRSNDQQKIFVPSLEGDYFIYDVGRTYNLAGGVVDYIEGNSPRFQEPRNASCRGAAFEVSKERLENQN